MNIHCRHCGEPWDHDELHEMKGWTGHDMSYRQAAKRFKELGCNAFKPDTGRLRERAGLPAKPKHCTLAPIYDRDMMFNIAMVQDMSDYPEEWNSPEDIEFMLEMATEMFKDI